MSLQKLIEFCEKRLFPLALGCEGFFTLVNYLFTKKGFKITGIRKEWVRRGNQWLDAHFLQLINKEYL